MIALLDYGSGNLRSVHRALLKVGAEVRIAQRPGEIGDARGMVLPGVGAFDDCMNALRKQELLGAAKDFTQTGKPFLGICVGYQALFERSEEFNSCAAGLGLFRGSVVRFTERNGLKIPQIGWNQLCYQNGSAGHPLFQDIPDATDFYFVHSYYCDLSTPGIIGGTTDYGLTFPSALLRDNLAAVQFHPEKSGRYGLQLLANFVRWASS